MTSIIVPPSTDKPTITPVKPVYVAKPIARPVVPTSLLKTTIVPPMPTNPQSSLQAKAPIQANGQSVQTIPASTPAATASKAEAVQTNKPETPQSLAQKQATATSNLLAKFTAKAAPTIAPAPTKPLPATTTTKPDLALKPKSPLVAKATTAKADPLAKYKPHLAKPLPTATLNKLADLAARAEAATSATPQELAAKIVSEATPASAQVTPKYLAAMAQQSGLTLPEHLATPEASGRVEKHQITLDLLNHEQRLAVELATQRVSFNLIGSAGSGKTTTQRMVLQQLAASGILTQLTKDWEHKYLPKGCLSIGVVSYMNKAVNNIRSALPTEFKSNALTIHKLLEYAPFEEEYEELDEEGQLIPKVRRGFRPTRTKDNKIDGLTHLIVEEASTVDMLLWEQLLDALPNRGADITFILLGDICQLPPVMGQSILRNSLATGRNVELTQIYRTANDSPIKKFAIAINEGKPFTDAQLQTEFAKRGELEFLPLSGKAPSGQKILRDRPQNLVHKIANMYKKELASGNFVPFRDTILCPYRVNKDDGINCQHLNLLLADFDGKRRNALVHEIRAGFQLRYLAIGDPVVIAKQEYRIVNIVPNPNYKGLPTKPASELLNRFGHYEGDSDSAILELESSHLDDIMALDIAALIDKKSAAEKDEESASRSASHIVTVASVDSDPELADIETEISQVGPLADLDFAYATTVHKSIGSEWERVYLCFHHTMSAMVSRELLYTAVTRAKLYLQVIYDGADPTSGKPNTSMIAKAILSPEIKGNSLAEKIAYIQKQELRKTEDTKAVLAKFAPKPQVPKPTTPTAPTSTK